MKLFVNAGDKVKEDETLFVIEAMKMQTNIKSNYKGTVEKLPLNEGENVRCRRFSCKTGYYSSINSIASTNSSAIPGWPCLLAASMPFLYVSMAFSVSPSSM